MTTVLLDKNKSCRKDSGIQNFHDAGYYGERVTAATGEPYKVSAYNPDGLVIDGVNSITTMEHAVQCAATFFQVAPKSKLVTLNNNSGAMYGNGTYKSLFFTECADVIEKYNILNMYNSFTTDANASYLNDLNTYLKNNPQFKQFWSAGNDSTKSYNKVLQATETIGVAAYEWASSGSYKPANFSSVSEYVDFIAPSGIYVNISNNEVVVHGTSFSAPWLCGMACLVDDFFIDKTGKPLTREMMIQFFKDHSVDMGDKGFDSKCGFGKVVLPKLSEIDVNKYRSDDVLEKFKDANKVASWATASVEYCLSKGYMNGKGATFDPKGIVTREEMACLIERIVKSIK